VPCHEAPRATRLSPFDGPSDCSEETWDHSSQTSLLSIPSVPCHVHNPVRTRAGWKRADLVVSALVEFSLLASNVFPHG